MALGPESTDGERRLGVSPRRRDLVRRRGWRDLWRRADPRGRSSPESESESDHVNSAGSSGESKFDHYVLSLSGKFFLFGSFVIWER